MIKNVHANNLILFIGVLFIAFLAIISSAIITGLINTIRFLIIDAEMENLRDTAFNAVNTSNPWNLFNELLRGVLTIVFIKIFYRVFGKSSISLGSLGLHKNMKQFIYILAGIALMTGMFLLALFVNRGGQEMLLSITRTFSQKSLVILILIAWGNAFWQEVIFRGYFQKHLINAYGILPGIILGAFLFTLLHGVVRDIDLTEIILGTVLFTFVGALFFLTKSIWIATAIHATGNFFLQSFDTLGLFIPTQFYRLTVYGVVLIVVLIMYRQLKFEPDFLQKGRV